MNPGRLLARASAIDVAATMRHLDRQGLKGRQHSRSNARHVVRSGTPAAACTVSRVAELPCSHGHRPRGVRRTAGPGGMRWVSDPADPQPIASCQACLFDRPLPTSPARLCVERPRLSISAGWPLSNWTNQAAFERQRLSGSSRKSTSQSPAWCPGVSMSNSRPSRHARGRKPWATVAQPGPRPGLMNSRKVPSLEQAVLPRTADRAKVHAKDRMPRSHSGCHAMRRRREILLLPVSCADSDKKIARLGPAQPILMHRTCVS